MKNIFIQQIQSLQVIVNHKLLTIVSRMVFKSSNTDFPLLITNQRPLMRETNTNISTLIFQFGDITFLETLGKINVFNTESLI